MEKRAGEVDGCGGRGGLVQKDASFDDLSGSLGEKVLQMDKSEQACGNLDAAAQVTPRSSDGLPASGEDIMPGPGSQPYDPLTNYLSPRPRFLRYDPKRLREIYLRREREQAVDAEFDSPIADEVENLRSERSASPSPLRPSSEQEEYFESDASQGRDSCENLVGEDEGTAEEEEPSSCSPIWKILLLLGILFSAAGYICSSQSVSTQTFSNRLQIVKERHLQDAPKMISGNTGVNLDNHTRAVWSSAHFGALATANSGVGSDSIGKLLNFCEAAEGGKLQEDDDPVVMDIGDHYQEEESEGSVSVEEKNQDDFSVAGDAEHAIDEEQRHGIEMMMMMMAGDGNQMVDNGSLDADTAVLGDENERNGSADLDQEKGNIAGAFLEEHPADITVETETGAMPDLKKPEEAPQGRAAADHGGNATFVSYGMKALPAALLAVLAAAAAGRISFRSRRPRDVETPSVGPAAERGVTLPSTEELEKSFDSLSAGNFKAHASRPPAAELLKGSIVGSFAGNRESKMSYETRPPSVELLGEFSVAGAAGFRGSGRSRAATGKLRRSEPSEMPTGSSLASLERSPSEFSTTESTQEKTARKQSNRHKREAEEGAGSTPLRRSSRIRNRVATP